MTDSKLLRLLVIILFAAGISFGARYTVSKDGRGQYTSVQEAVKAAKSGDEVVILDFAVYEEQVTIDSSKNRLVLRSENPKLRLKPTITFQDTDNQGPRTYDESQDPATITFDQNGAVRVMRAQGVRIEGIILDGGGAAPFGWEGIWERRFPLFHGNAALTLFVAGDVIVRDCEIQNSYFGIYVKDRNEGGIYANANPADLEPQNVVPLSGFGKTGNHLFEQNRLHDNAWGMFFESAWDLGSNIRYNLFYANYLPAKLQETVADLPGGGNQHGGAILFKDMLLSPLAIYNNTFYDNNLTFCADWQVGGQNIAFNNIIAQPHGGKVSGSHQELAIGMPNRMFNNLYAAQEQAPTVRSQEYQAGMQDPETNEYVQAKVTYEGVGYVRILNGFPNMAPAVQVFDIEIPLSTGTVTRPVTVDWDILPGTLIEQAGVDKPFPAEAENRWFEIEFVSTDPESPDFLVPDWTDSTVQELVIDKGWADAALRDADGSPADIGAIPMGGIPETEVLVKPRDPVIINNNTKAKVKFEIIPLVDGFSNPKIKYVRWIRNIEYMDDIFGVSNIDIISQNEIVEVPVPAEKLVVGTNTLTFDIPSMDDNYGFFDMIIEGTNSNGEVVTTNVGFMPYRQIDYIFDVIVMNEAGTEEVTSVQAGENVQLWITPLRLDGNPFDAKVDEVSVSLSSNYELLTPGGEVFAIPDGIQGISKNTVVFTKVPESGYDGVEVSGMFTNPNDPKAFFPIRGSSKDIRINPGPPEVIVFQDPPSKGVKVIDRGGAHDVTLQVTDRYDNNINSSTSVGMVSNDKNVGDVVTGTVETDETGLAVFQVRVTNGELNDTFPIVATLLVNNATDDAKIVVGKARDKFWIFYSDIGAYDETLRLEGCSGSRMPVTIWASGEGLEKIEDQTSAFSIDLSGGLIAYASEDPADTVRITESALVAGEKTIWIKATTKNIANGTIFVFSPDQTVDGMSRENIYFTPCNASVNKAAYFADNGYGRVDRVTISFDKKLAETEIPDSIQFCWPSDEAECKMVRKTDCHLMEGDSSVLVVQLPEPFPPSITRFTRSNLALGTYYWWNPLTPDAPSQTIPFSIADSVGPLLESATLVERLGPGDDVLFISFTENVTFDVVQGQSLTLIKGTQRIPLMVDSAAPLAGTPMIRVVIKDMGENSPAAGDSLMITPAGPIVDASGNHAHELNRPVELQIRQVPADIVQAVYQDLNADGRVDNVVLSFNKKVNPSQMEISFQWNGTAGSEMAGANRISLVDESQMVVNVDVNGLWAEEDVADKTSGNMLAQVFFTAFAEDNVKSAAVEDNAAPVLVEVKYHIGKSLNGIKEKDSVSFVLSELVQVAAEMEMPLFFKGEDGGYTLTLQYLRGGGTQYFYIVEAVNGAPTDDIIAQRGDSVWINPEAGVADETGNGQINPENKRVTLEIVLPPFSPSITVGPNPFDPKSMDSNNRNAKIVVKPETVEALDVTITATAVIYDKVGNIVRKFPQVTNQNSLEILWDGTNERGRFVGSGTYLGVIECEFATQGIIFTTKETFMVGVR